MASVTDIIVVDGAWARHKKIVDLRYRAEDTFLELGKELYEFEGQKQYLDLGYTTFEQYLAQKEEQAQQTLSQKKRDEVSL